MKKIRLSSLLASLLLFSATASAQVAASPTPVRYYVALSSIRSNYEVFYPTTPQLAVITTGQATVGVQFNPRWAMQLGYAYSRDKSSQDPAYTGTTLAGQYITGRRSNDSWEQAFPLLVRYALIGRPNPRLQIDFIGGGTVVDGRFSVHYIDFVDGQVVREFNAGDHVTQLYFTAGLGVRYPFGKHFEGVFDYMLSRNFKAVPASFHQQVSGSSLGLTRAFSLGLRYRFALHKKAITPASL